MNKLEMYTNILGDMRQTYINKSKDYGDSFGRSVAKYGMISALTRISDKFNRLESLILKDTQEVKDETINDTLLDLACYSIMTIIELEEKRINLNNETGNECMIKSYHLQEKEYIDLIEGLQDKIKSLENANANIKSQKEEMEKAKQNLGKTLQNKLDYIKKLEESLGNYY